MEEGIMPDRRSTWTHAYQVTWKKVLQRPASQPTHTPVRARVASSHRAQQRAPQREYAISNNVTPDRRSTWTHAYQVTWKKVLQRPASQPTHTPVRARVASSHRAQQRAPQREYAISNNVTPDRRSTWTHAYQVTWKKVLQRPASQPTHTPVRARVASSHRAQQRAPQREYAISNNVTPDRRSTWTHAYQVTWKKVLQRPASQPTHTPVRARVASSHRAQQRAPQREYAISNNVTPDRRSTWTHAYQVTWKKVLQRPASQPTHTPVRARVASSHRAQQRAPQREYAISNNVTPDRRSTWTHAYQVTWKKVLQRPASQPTHTPVRARVASSHRAQQRAPQREYAISNNVTPDRRSTWTHAYQVTWKKVLQRPASQPTHTPVRARVASSHRAQQRAPQREYAISNNVTPDRRSTF
ncbi:hypothetical protein O0L34_g4500 [Tuta absoluta]|nr:hypothetical protein O0L34_g4500 [Tuta absoluta]